MHTNMKILNKKKLWLKTLVNSEYTHTRIDKKLVNEEKIKIKPIDRLFKVFNTDGTKNGEVIIFVLLELEINRYMKIINAVVIDLDGMDIFLGYNWLVKHNPEVNWDKKTI